jgi:hypothetical protein
MFYSETKSFLNFLRILHRLEVGVFARTIKLDSPVQGVEWILVLLRAKKVGHQRHCLDF